MRLMSAIFLLALSFVVVQPSYAVQTTIIVGTTEIITPSNEDFERMPVDQMGEWLFDRSNLLGTINRDIESLNREDAVDLIRQVKFDRGCARGMSWCGRIFGAAVVITGLASSIATLPPQVGYALAGGGALVVGFNELMKFFTGRANQGVTTLLDLQRELLEDYWEKQRIYERRLAEQEREQRFLEEFNAWRRLAIQNLPPGTRNIIFDPEQTGRLRIMSAQGAGDDVDAMERGELREQRGRQPNNAPEPGQEPVRRLKPKTKVKVPRHAKPRAENVRVIEEDTEAPALERRPKEKEDEDLGAKEQLGDPEK